MIIYYLITNSCNLSCVHCIRGDSSNDRMSCSDAIEGMHNIYSSHPDSVIILSGGEPTTHPDFEEILTYASKYFHNVVINSNGTTPFFQYSNAWQNDNICVQFSLDGEEQYHNQIRGDDNYQKTISNIEYINNCGFPIWISSVVSNANYESIKRLPKILYNYHIAKWQVAPTMPFGYADLSHILSIQKWNDLVDYLIENTPFRLGIKKLFDMSKLDSLSNDEIRHISSSDRNKALKNCGCITEKVYVYPNMNVYPCTCQANSSIGSLTCTPFSDIIYNALSSCFITTNPICKKCRYLPICNGGCTGMQIKYGADVRCPIIQKYHNA